MEPLPDWLAPLARQVRGTLPEPFARFAPPPGATPRLGAVLALFGEGAAGPDLLFIRRATTLRSHPGQPAFPGGKVDPDDAGPVATALREAGEEVGLQPSGVTPFATLPPLYLPPSDFAVTTVLGWWHDPHEVRVVDAAEVAAVARIPLAELADPANRCSVALRADRTGPGFRVGDMLVWGFTAGLVDMLLAMGGWARPWGPGPVVDRPPLPAEDPAVEEAVGGS